MRALRSNRQAGLGRRGYREGHFASADSAAVLDQGHHSGRAPKGAQGSTEMTLKPAKRRDAQMVRILAELGILLEGGLPTVHELATRFNTRRETIYRDLKTLQEAGYPITGEGGLLSHPRLLYRPRQARPAIRLNGPEIDALLWAAGQMGAQHPFQTEFAAATTKLRGMLAAHALATKG